MGFRFGFNNVTASAAGAVPQPVPFTESLKDLEIKQRLTFIVDDSASQHLLTGGYTAYGNWDIVAAAPQTEKAFSLVCERAEIDIISIPLGERLGFKLRPQPIKTALQRGILFELCCDSLLKGPFLLVSAAFSLFFLLVYFFVLGVRRWECKA